MTGRRDVDSDIRAPGAAGPVDSSRSGKSRINGRAYGYPATLEVASDILTWRAQRGRLSPVAENIVTTVHDVSSVSWLERSWSLPGGILALLGALWIFTEGIWSGALALGLAAALLAWRRTHPQLYLALDMRDRRLVLKVAVASAVPARALVRRVESAIATGELPATPPALP